MDSFFGGIAERPSALDAGAKMHVGAPPDFRIFPGDGEFYTSS